MSRVARDLPSLLAGRGRGWVVYGVHGSADPFGLGVAAFFAEGDVGGAGAAEADGVGAADADAEGAGGADPCAAGDAEGAGDGDADGAGGGAGGTGTFPVSASTRPTSHQFPSDRTLSSHHSLASTPRNVRTQRTGWPA